jgi:hypothetical protein
MIRARPPAATLLFLVFGLACAGALTALVLWGRAYFVLPAVQRPLHELHALFRSSGSIGLTCGIAGSALFVLNLSYLLRKHLLKVRWLGSLRAWMSFHVFTGITGSLLILVHSSFQPRSSLGILAFACLGIVVTTGLVGRYIYAQVPRSLGGRELRVEELRHRLLQYRSRLAHHGLAFAWLDLPSQTSDPEENKRGTLARLAGVLAGNHALRRRYRDLQDMIQRDPDLSGDAAEILPLAREFLADRQRLERYADLRGLMGSWRFLHRWLAIVMIAMVAFHVALALRWGFGH